MVFSQLPPQRFWGLFEYKPQWTLTLKGWLFFCFVSLLLLISFAVSIHPFLRVSHPLDAQIMIVEGWMSDGAIEGAIAEFKDKNYRLMITTGNEIGRGKYLSDYKTFADLAAATAIALGFDSQKIVKVPNATVKVNRTAASAEAVKKWLLASNLNVKAINIYSYDVHTRRSWLVFRRVLGPEIQVGAIAFPSPNYNAETWWTTSEGVKSVIFETIAYLYAKFLWQYKN